MDYQEKNKRIAKNTLILYFRMFFMMIVVFYTSRIILKNLGITDYGLYNVIGGIVAIIDFINTAMAHSTSRFITIELCQNNRSKLQEVFSMAFNIHAIIAIVVVVLSETVGLWYFYEYLVIPPERLEAAFWVYQISIVTAVVIICSTPYNACIIAHEKMSVFAYISIVDVVLQLFIVCLLAHSPIDKLVFYASMLFCIKLLCRFIYSIYCSKYIARCRFRFFWDKGLFRQMLSFATWCFFGDMAAVGINQGISLLINLFFSPVVNAARGIVLQMQSALVRFVINFQIALNPQITKSYAIDDMERVHLLIYSSSRLSFFLLLIVSLPVWLQAPFILNLWLETVPDHTVAFFRIAIITSLIDSFGNPLIVAAKATGKIKLFELGVSFILLLNLPISYFFLKWGYPVEIVYYVQLAISIVALFIRLYLVYLLIHLSMYEYLVRVVLKTMSVLMITLLFAYAINSLWSASITHIIILNLFLFIVMLIVVYGVGLERSERLFVTQKIRALLIRTIDERFISN